MGDLYLTITEISTSRNFESINAVFQFSSCSPNGLNMCNALRDFITLAENWEAITYVRPFIGNFVFFLIFFYRIFCCSFMLYGISFVLLTRGYMTCTLWKSLRARAPWLCHKRFLIYLLFLFIFYYCNCKLCVHCSRNCCKNISLWFLMQCCHTHRWELNGFPTWESFSLFMSFIW